MDGRISASLTRSLACALVALFLLLLNSGCTTRELPEALRQTFAARPLIAVAAPPGNAGATVASSGPLLVVMTYGWGCAGSGPGNGLRDLADMIRQRYPEQRVI